MMAKGKANGEITNPIMTPSTAQIIPNRKPITAKRSFIPMSQINPSRLNSQIRPGKRMPLIPINSITDLVALSSKNKEQLKEKANTAKRMLVTASASADKKAMMHASAIASDTPRLHQSLV